MTAADNVLLELVLVVALVIFAASIAAGWYGRRRTPVPLPPRWGAMGRRSSHR